MPSLWSELVGGWQSTAPAPDAQTAMFLLQNMFGVWPRDGVVSAELRQRLHAYAEKAIREAALHTTWNDPDTGFEEAVHAWIDTVIDGPVAVDDGAPGASGLIGVRWADDPEFGDGSQRCSVLYGLVGRPVLTHAH